MPQAPRGKPLPINSALNASRTKLGLELPYWIAIVSVSILVFLAGFHLLSPLAFALFAGGAWLATRKNPKLVKLWWLSWQQKAMYDPRKR